VAEYGASGDDTARFLRELRQLRDSAGLGQAELAARAHYPYDTIRAAEIGPELPELPILSAYVRGCGGTTEEWEERWRSLTRTPSLPLSGARTGGNSAAATAGARISSSALDAETPDPAVIMAALDRVAEGMAVSGTETAPGPAEGSPWPDFPPDAPPPARMPADQAPDGQPAGWDPIRVSSAWPALKEPPADQAASGGGRASGSGASPASAAPWDRAPWAEDPGMANPATSASGPGAGSASPAPPSGGPAHAAGAPGSASRTRIIVVAVILLCVLAVVLAIFI
jgi:hypothetical protein